MLTNIQILGIVLALLYFCTAFVAYQLKERALEAASQSDYLNITMARPNEYGIGFTIFILVMVISVADLINNISIANFSLSSIIRYIAITTVGMWVIDFFRSKDDKEKELAEEELVKLAEEKLPQSYLNAERLGTGIQIAALAFCFIYLIIVY